MIKHIIFFIVLSVVAILGQPYIQIGLHQLLAVHSMLLDLFSKIFTGNEVAEIIKKTLGILILPLVFTGIIAFIYWIFRRSVFPHAIMITWIFWLILVTAMMMQ